MEQAALFGHIVGEAVRELSLVGQVDDDMRPLLPLHPVHGCQYDALVELVCRDTQHFQELLIDSIQSIEGVLSTESFLILEIHKMAYGWGAGDAGVPLADTP